MRAKTSMRPNHHRRVNGESVRFHGRIKTGRIPPGGKLVELQVWIRGSAGSVGSYVVGFADSVSACAATATVGTADASIAQAGTANTSVVSDRVVGVQTLQCGRRGDGPAVPSQRDLLAGKASGGWDLGRPPRRRRQARPHPRCDFKLIPR